MKLIVHELKTSLEQKILNHENINVESVRLHLYKHNNPAGKLKIILTNETNNVEIAQSEEVEISQIDGQFYHGQIRFDIKTQFKKDNYYKITLVPVDYDFSEGAYIGWCADFEFNTHETDYEITELIKSPFDYEIWARK